MQWYYILSDNGAIIYHSAIKINNSRNKVRNMDEQKSNYEDSTEQPTAESTPPIDDRIQGTSTHDQRKRAERHLSDQVTYVHRDDDALRASTRHAVNTDVKQSCRQKERSCKWHIFFAVLLTASLTFLATAGLGCALFGPTIRDILPVETRSTDPIQTQPTSPMVTSPQSDGPSAESDHGVTLSEDGLSITFKDRDGVKDALAKFVSVYRLLQDNYYQEFTDSEMIDKIIEGLATKMGSPYTFYLTPEYYKSIEESMSGEYTGIGAFVMRDQSSRYIVNDLIPGGPAEKGGLHVGDVFQKIDEVDASTFEDVGQLAAAVRGEAGTDVTLVMFRPSTNEELTLKLTRAHITNVSVRARMLEDNIGYIQVSEFSEKVATNFENATKELLQEGATSFIFDLRNNGGGYAHECIDMLDVLLPPMEVASLKGRQDGKDYTEVWKTKKPAIVPEDMKFVVLLNENSASASELFTGALHDLGRAVIVGQTSFGKGVGTVTVQLPDNSAVQVTNFMYYLPNGQSVEGVGLEPDYAVALPAEVAGKPISSLTLEEDTQLSKAIELLRP